MRPQCGFKLDISAAIGPHDSLTVMMPIYGMDMVGIQILHIKIEVSNMIRYVAPIFKYPYIKD